ncbi:hypothetical protein EDC01DRAFT_786670 [Geopyxis carbonaria]|nr:hypothetical protein EDC01DRAFT_786670 [Geopyxis carbonaria]
MMAVEQERDMIELLLDRMFESGEELDLSLPFLSRAIDDRDGCEATDRRWQTSFLSISSSPTSPLSPASPNFKQRFSAISPISSEFSDISYRVRTPPERPPPPSPERDSAFEPPPLPSHQITTLSTPSPPPSPPLIQLKPRPQKPQQKPPQLQLTPPSILDSIPTPLLPLVYVQHPPLPSLQRPRLYQLNTGTLTNLPAPIPEIPTPVSSNPRTPQTPRRFNPPMFLPTRTSRKSCEIAADLSGLPSFPQTPNTATAATPVTTKAQHRRRSIIRRRSKTVPLTGCTSTTCTTTTPAVRRRRSVLASLIRGNGRPKPRAIRSEHPRPEHARALSASSTWKTISQISIEQTISRISVEQTVETRSSIDHDAATRPTAKALPPIPSPPPIPTALKRSDSIRNKRKKGAAAAAPKIERPVSLDVMVNAQMIGKAERRKSKEVTAGDRRRSRDVARKESLECKAPMVSVVEVRNSREMHYRGGSRDEKELLVSAKVVEKRMSASINRGLPRVRALRKGGLYG